MQVLVSKQTAVAFALPTPGSPASPPESLKQRLAAAKKEELSSEAIAEKLCRAEAKRQQLLRQRCQAEEGLTITEKRLKAASERRENNLAGSVGFAEKLKERCSREEAHAAENRRQRCERQLEKLRNHISRVEEVRRGQAELRQSRSKKTLEQLGERQESAARRREESLLKKQQIAHQSAERKLYFEDGTSA